MAAEDLAVFFYADTVEGLLDVLKWQALLIFRRHLDPFLQQQHIQVENLVELWAQLHVRFHYEQMIFLP